MYAKALMATIASGALAMLLGATPAAGSCVTCTVGQDCEPGSMGSYCRIFYLDGDRWCNWDGGCNMTLGVPVTPAGTYASVASDVLSDGTVVDRCTGFVIRFAAVDVEGSSDIDAIRI